MDTMVCMAPVTGWRQLPLTVLYVHVCSELALPVQIFT